MESEKNQLSRKNFLSWTAAVGALMAIPAFLRTPKKKTGTKTVKMLTQDGKLVMVDVSNIPAKKKKASLSAIHNWINKKSNSN